jgi:hypothetical protein
VSFLPIVERELRAAARRPGTHRTRLLAALAVILVWLLLLGGSHGASPPTLSKSLFVAFGVMALGFCLLAGLFLTADCLSEEKREGTLGLLFLTDLRSYDVVLGKLIATSIHSVYGLLAVFPILGLPLMMGGVTGAEFWRVVLTLVMTLLLSLSLGMWVSAITREARQAMGRTFLGMLVLAGLLPALWWLRVLSFQTRVPPPAVLLPSPVNTFIYAFDAYFQTRNGPHEYWGSLQMIFCLSIGFLVLAAIKLPRSWQEGARSEMPLARWFEAAFRAVQSRLTRSPGRGSNASERRVPSVDSLETNPYLWLACRRQPRETLARILLGGLVLLWFCFLALAVTSSNGKDPFVACLFTAYAIHQVGKYLAAVEATRQLGEDRRTGALELLLVTPLPETHIVSALASSFARRFRGLKAILLLVNLCMCLTVLCARNKLRMSDSDVAIFLELFIGGILMLFLDFSAISKAGIWAALRARRHHRAVLAVLARVMLAPWATVFLIIFLMSNHKGGISTASVSLIFAFWFAVGIITDLLAHTRAQLGLRQGLRPLLAGELAPDKGESQPPAPDSPAHAPLPLVTGSTR